MGVGVFEVAAVAVTARVVGVGYVVNESDGVMWSYAIWNRVLLGPNFSARLWAPISLVSLRL